MFFSNKKENNPFIDKLNNQVDSVYRNLTKDFKIENIKIKIELILFYYFLTDLFMSENDIDKSEREKVSDSVFESIKKIISQFNNDETFSFDLTNLFNNRIVSYSEILSKNENDLSNSFFKDVYEYQVELLSAIRIKNRFSKYNPCPKSPLEVCPKIINTIVNSEIRNGLINNHESTVKYIESLFSKKNENDNLKSSNIDLDLIKKYATSISQIFFEELKIENEQIQSEFYVYLCVLYCYAKNISKNSLPENEINNFAKKEYKKLNSNLFLSRFELFSEDFEKADFKVNTDFITRTFFQLSGITSFSYCNLESIPVTNEESKSITKEQEERKYEIECRCYTALYTSIDLILKFLSDISASKYFEEKQTIFNEILTLNGLSKYKKLLDNQIFDLDELLKLYNFKIKDGYYLRDIPFFIIDPIYRKYSHSLVPTKIDDKNPKRFNYTYRIDTRRAYINYTLCEDNKNIFEYLLFQIILEKYENINNPNNWKVLVTDENEIKEYQDLLKKNPVINESFVNSEYPNILSYNDFYYIGLYSHEQQGVYFKIYKLKSGFSYDIVYEELIKKNEHILMF